MRRPMTFAEAEAYYRGGTTPPEQAQPQDADLLGGKHMDCIMCKECGHDIDNHTWKGCLVKACKCRQKPSDIIEAAGYHRCPKVPWPVLGHGQVDIDLWSEEQRDADWKACHKEEK